MADSLTSNQCYEGRGGVSGKRCNFYPKCVCGDRDALRPPPNALCDEIRNIARDAPMSAGTRTRLHAIAHDIENALAPKPTPVETSRDDATDAAKWRALRNCARITPMGCAGLTQPHNVADAYAHLTLNFWTGVPDGDPGPGYAREWLDKFVAKAQRAMPPLEPEAERARRIGSRIP